MTNTESDVFFREYTSPDAITKYTRQTAGYGISHLLDHDYQSIYLQAIDLLPPETLRRGLRILEFGCGGGMNLLHLVSVLGNRGIKVSKAVGTDFSPVLIEAAKREANNYPGGPAGNVEFYVAKNETLMDDLSPVLNKATAELKSSFDFVLGVNTTRYGHRAKKELDCAQLLFDLLTPGGVCVMIDMNDRFPLFRSALRNRFGQADQNEEECYIPSLEEYAKPFVEAGFELKRKANFCWIPHSAGQSMTRIYHLLSPILSFIAPSRAMRSLVVARKPALA